MVVNLGNLPEFVVLFLAPLLPTNANPQDWIDYQPWGSILDAFEWYDCAVDDLNESAADEEDEALLDSLEKSEQITDKLREMLRSLFDFDYQCSNQTPQEIYQQNMEAAYAKAFAKCPPLQTQGTPMTTIELLQLIKNKSLGEISEILKENDTAFKAFTEDFIADYPPLFLSIKINFGSLESFKSSIK